MVLPRPRRPLTPRRNRTLLPRPHRPRMQPPNRMLQRLLPTPPPRHLPMVPQRNPTLLPSPLLRPMQPSLQGMPLTRRQPAMQRPPLRLMPRRQRVMPPPTRRLPPPQRAMPRPATVTPAPMRPYRPMSRKAARCRLPRRIIPMPAPRPTTTRRTAIRLVRWSSDDPGAV